MPTRGEVAELLSAYAGNRNDFNTRLDLVRAELLPKGNWRGSKVPVFLTIYQDVDGRFIVTLPRIYNTILAGVANPPSNVIQPYCRYPMEVRNGWFESMPYSYGLNGYLSCAGTGSFNEVNGRFCTFQDWTGPLQLRFKFIAAENSGKILIQGTSNGSEVYSAGPPVVRGEKVVFSGTADVTTVNSFDARNLYVVKPETRGPVSMWSVETTNGQTETLVAIFDPGETVIRWKRYYVPNIPDPTSNQFLAICKIAFVRLTSDDDECVPGNISALRRGFEALKMEDAHDVRASAKWAESKEGLIDEREDDQGAGATGKVIVEDTFNIGGMNAEMVGPYWDGWYG